MAFRNVVIESPARISVKNDQLLITADREYSLPVDASAGKPAIHHYNSRPVPSGAERLRFICVRRKAFALRCAYAVFPAQPGTFDGADAWRGRWQSMAFCPPSAYTITASSTPMIFFLAV